MCFPTTKLKKMWLDFRTYSDFFNKGDTIWILIWKDVSQIVLAEKLQTIIGFNKNKRLSVDKIHLQKWNKSHVRRRSLTVRCVGTKISWFHRWWSFLPTQSADVIWCRLWIFSSTCFVFRDYWCIIKQIIIIDFNVFGCFFTETVCRSWLASFCIKLMHSLRLFYWSIFHWPIS